jgi:hypothetical protein
VKAPHTAGREVSLGDITSLPVADGAVEAVADFGSTPLAARTT